ncbi:MAG TPA: hypothetical protein VGI10_21175 [Polyangiaceae bacterium]
MVQAASGASETWRTSLAARTGALLSGAVDATSAAGGSEEASGGVSLATKGASAELAAAALAAGTALAREDADGGPEAGGAASNSGAGPGGSRANATRLTCTLLCDVGRSGFGQARTSSASPSTQPVAIATARQFVPVARKVNPSWVSAD